MAVSTSYAIAKLKSRMDAEEILAEREDALQCKPGNKRGKSAAAAIGANVATGLGAYAAYAALKKKEDSMEVESAKKKS